MPARINIAKLKGTAFQKKVWQQLLKIPRGKTMTYGELARVIGHPKAARAVGSACNANPLPIVIPCHRVVARDGSLGGYAGGIQAKLRLLQSEKNRSATQNTKINAIILKL